MQEIKYLMVITAGEICRACQGFQETYWIIEAHRSTEIEDHIIHE